MRAQGVLPLIPAQVGGIALQDPVKDWWTDLHRKEGACGKCLLTVLYTLVEFMCLMTVPTIVGAVLVLVAAFAPAAAELAIKTMETQVRAFPPRKPTQAGARLSSPHATSR